MTSSRAVPNSPEPRRRGAPRQEPLVKRRRGKILYSLLAVMLLLGVVPLLVTSELLTSNSEEYLEFGERELQLDQTLSIRDQIRLYLQAQHQQVIAIAKSFGVGSDPAAVAARIGAASQRDELIQYIGEESRIQAIVVSGLSNQAYVAGPAASFAQQLREYLYEESIAEGRQGRYYVSPPYVDADVLVDTVMVVASPIFVTLPGGGDQEVAGVVSAVVSLQPIQALVKSKSLEGRECYVVDGQGALVAHSNLENVFKHQDLSSSELVRAFKDAKGQVSSFVPFEQITNGKTQEMLGTHTSIGDRGSTVAILRTLDWGVIVQAEREKVMSRVKQMRTTSYTIAVAAAALALFAGVLFAGRLSHPIARLAEGARKLAEGDFSHAIEVKSSNEIGELADTFNKMTAEIKKFIERIKKAAEENKQMFLGSVGALAAAIDAKDPYTRGHSERVANYAEQIAKVLALPEAEVERVRISALMHDVGKIGIEDRILGKAGPLTDEEYMIMKTHPTKGAVIMEQVPHLKDLIPGMKYHHENVDGSGYPEGLKGDAIPLSAKIVSVADTFDAMTTNRPYQKAMEITYVLERMRSFVGKKFEKRIVEALITAYEEGRIRLAAPARKREVLEPVPVGAGVQKA